MVMLLPREPALTVQAKQPPIGRPIDGATIAMRVSFVLPAEGGQGPMAISRKRQVSYLQQEAECQIMSVVVTLNQQ